MPWIACRAWLVVRASVSSMRAFCVDKSSATMKPVSSFFGIMMIRPRFCRKNYRCSGTKSPMILPPGTGDLL